jgi:hypothetical protein
MYIAGEGLKRPQHRDHPWSIVLYTRSYLYPIIDHKPVYSHTQLCANIVEW